MAKGLRFSDDLTAIKFAEKRANMSGSAFCLVVVGGFLWVKKYSDALRLGNVVIEVVRPVSC